MNNMKENGKELLRARELSRIYGSSDTAVHAVHNISLEIYRNEIVVFEGPSGAGKSTLLHVLGLLDRPTNGELLYEGQNIEDWDDARLSVWRNERIGFIFQFHHLLPEFTALENVFIPGWIGISFSNRPQRARVRRNAEEMLAHLGLEKRLHHKPNQLSGGEQQRVALARALINEPQVVFADEPIGNLDRKTGIRLLEELISYIRDLQKTLVLVTHDEEQKRYGDRVITIIDGEIAAARTVSEPAGREA